MKRLYVFTISFLLSIIVINAQNETDALRYAQIFPTGTARSSGMGGAFSAFGADFSTLSINPAGIGVYRSSEFTVTPSMDYSLTSSQYLGQKSNDNTSAFYLGNLGFVYSHLTGKKQGLVGINFGLGYNREKNFNNSLIMSGVNQNSSLLDDFAYRADGTESDNLYEFEEGLAWDIYMIDTVNGQPLNYETVYSMWGDNPSSTYGQAQRRILETTGGIGEYVFSLGFNLGNMLYLGGTFGIHSLKYNQHMTHHEEDETGNIQEFDYFTLDEWLNVSGTAYSFKLGILLKPIQLLRIGAAVHFPYSYKIDENYSTYMKGGFDTPVDGVYEYESESPMLDYRYGLETPLKAVGNVGIQIAKFALIGVDVEYVDYTSMKLKNGSDGYDFYDENQSIDNAYRSVLNFRAGAEFRFWMMKFRVGAAYYESPYVDTEINSDANYINLTGGLGFRDEHFFFDLAYIYSQHKDRYIMYQYPPAEAAVIDFSKHNLMATIGFRF